MRWLNAVILLVFLLFPSMNARAQTGEPLSNVLLDYEFGSTINISAEITQPAVFSSMLLILQPDGQSPRQLSMEADSEGFVSITYDLSQQPIHPFARVYYWFELTRQDGSVHTTSSYWFDYLDNRFTWQTNQSDLFEISWVDGDAAFGLKLQEIAREGLKKATTTLTVAPDLPIRIFVYPTVAALKEALNLSGQDWTAGHASPEIGVILVSNDNPTPERIEMERQIPHELMHILEYQATKGQYSNNPVWLSEGLATSVELYPDPDLQRVFNEAYANNSLFPFSSLCEGFPPDATDAQLAYAQSASFVNFLYGRFGSQTILKLIENSTSGLTCENSVLTTLNSPLDQLQQEWLTQTFNDSTNDLSFEEFLPFLIAGFVLMLALLIVVLRIRRRQWRE